MQFVYLQLKVDGVLQVPKSVQVLNCLKEWHLIYVFKCVSQHARKVYGDRGIINARNLACHFPELLASEILIWMLHVILSCIL